MEYFFDTSRSAHIETSIVDAQGLARGYPVNTYLQNLHMDTFDHEVVSDSDNYARGLVSFIEKSSF